VLCAYEPQTFLWRSLQAIFPDSVDHRAKKGSKVIRFCPDNTCDEFRAAPAARLDDLALVYLYYFGDYYELSTWRNAPHVRDSIAAAVRTLGLQDCVSGAADPKDCMGKGLRRRGLKVYSVRFDEGRESVQPIWR